MTGPADLPARAAYDRWSRTYRVTGRNALADAAERAVMAVLPVPSGMDLLDVGCGDGRWMAILRRRGAARVFGVDLSRGMLDAARRQAPRAPVAAADMRRLPFAPATFDGALHALALGHVRELGAAMAAVACVLRPGGWLVLADVHPTAAARGWRRTFRDADGASRAVRWYPHPLATVVGACLAAGLQVERVSECAVDPRALPSGAPAEASGGPAAYALRARRLGSAARRRTGAVC